MAEEWKKLAVEGDCILDTVLSAEGDLLISSDIATPGRLAHGTDGQVLEVNEGEDAPTYGDWDVDELAPHASTHEHAGDDILYMDNLEAVGPVDFNGQQAKDLVIHKAAATPTPVVGKWYFDTGLVAAYVCTSAA